MLEIIICIDTDDTDYRTRALSGLKGSWGCEYLLAFESLFYH